ncbi:hypothetical protein GWI34_05680 [Actinomadura sp. DSM 109109]|nr:hypothetical protein [Actinomadura lepetitiana]
MRTLDGNAVAGLLHDIFGEEMTAATALCGTCGSAAVLADAVVYPHLPGHVLRCRNCTGLLIVATRIRGIHCLDLQGVAALDRPDDTRADTAGDRAPAAD